ncbi:MAG: LemA family protein, partial [Pirellulales bacterium]|nr:LemA family protein [Pirellulales bacterium]
MIIALTTEFGVTAFAFGVFTLFGLMLFVAVSFNRLVRHTNLVDEAFSGIDVQLKRRHELIPNLVECVKG